MRKKNKFIVLFLLLSMMGCTTPSQWKADAQVDELCAKDGGIKVYETVTLPKERFNEYGQLIGLGLTYAGDTKTLPEYYIYMEDTLISPYTSGQFGGLSVTRYQQQIYRKSDHKLLGEQIMYSRAGGDVIVIDAPSGYHCPENQKTEIEKIFLKQK
jgi:hypothetical protein